jgi:hypothetical protein
MLVGHLLDIGTFWVLQNALLLRNSSSNAKQLFESKAPDLTLAQRKTIADTTHPTRIVAPLRSWQTFEMEVRTATTNANFRDVTLDHQPAGSLRKYHCSKELYACSDEGDIQGRFNNNISKVVTAVFKSEGIMCQFSSGRSTTTHYGGVPDIVLTRVNGTQALLVGEFKTPWVHNLDDNTSIRRERRLGMLIRHAYSWHTDVLILAC